MRHSNEVEAPSPRSQMAPPQRGHVKPLAPFGGGVGGWTCCMALVLLIGGRDPTCPLAVLTVQPIEGGRSSGGARYAEIGLSASSLALYRVATPLVGHPGDGPEWEARDGDRDRVQGDA